MRYFVRRAGSVLGLVVLSVALTGCDRLFHSYTETAVTFNAQGTTLAGKIILPKDSEGPYPVVVFVHGDGPITYDCYGYYRFMWEHLARAGIASFAWNKPGIGGSGGNWELQSMEDRAEDVIAAMRFLRKWEAFDHRKIGLIGFSQAGWVLPIVAARSDDADLMVFISSAVNWLEQSEYMTENRLQEKGISEENIEQIQRYFQKEQQLLEKGESYEQYRNYRENNAPEPVRKYTEPLDKSRFTFVRKNWRYDAVKDLKKIEVPVLALFGGKDLNVNVKQTVRIYAEVFTESGNTDFTIKIFPNANHSLIDARYFNKISPGFIEQVKMQIVGEAIFADGVLNTLTGWVAERVDADTRQGSGQTDNGG